MTLSITFADILGKSKTIKVKLEARVFVIPLA